MATLLNRLFLVCSHLIAHSFSVSLLSFSPTLRLSHEQLSFADVVTTFTTPELLQGADQIYCSACRRTEDATKTLQLWSLPTIFVIHLKRLLAGKLASAPSLVLSAVPSRLAPLAAWRMISARVRSSSSNHTCDGSISLSLVCMWPINFHALSARCQAVAS